MTTLKTNTWKLTDRQHWTAVAVSSLSFVVAIDGVIAAYSIVSTLLGHMGVTFSGVMWAASIILILNVLSLIVLVPQSLFLQISIQGAPMKFWSFAWRGAAIASVVWGLLFWAFFWLIIWPLTGRNTSLTPMPEFAKTVVASALAGGLSGWALCQYLFLQERRGRLAAEDS